MIFLPKEKSIFRRQKLVSIKVTKKKNFFFLMEKIYFLNEKNYESFHIRKKSCQNKKKFYMVV